VINAFGVDDTRISKIAPRMVYHGTTRSAARKIMREGFKPSERGTFGPGVYTHSSRQRAEDWGDGRAFFRTPRKSRGAVVEAMAVGPDKIDMKVHGPYIRARKVDRGKYDPDQLIPTGYYKAPGTRKKRG
jgi:hypothetical protein